MFVFLDTLGGLPVLRLNSTGSASCTSSSGSHSSSSSGWGSSVGHLIGPTSRDVVRFGRGTSGILEEEDLDSGNQSVLGMFIQNIRCDWGGLNICRCCSPKNKHSVIINQTNVFPNMMFFYCTEKLNLKNIKQTVFQMTHSG